MTAGVITRWDLTEVRGSTKFLRCYNYRLPQYRNSSGTKKFAIHQVTSSMLAVYRAGLFPITIDHSHRLVNFWVEYFAFTFKGCDSVRFKKIVESLIDQAETVRDRI